MMNLSDMASLKREDLKEPAIFCALLALALLIAMIFPRSFSYTPALLGLGAFLILVIKERQNMQRLMMPFFFSGVVLGLALLSCFWSVDFDISIERVLKMSPILIFGALLIYAVRYLDEKWLRLFYSVLPYVVMTGLAWNIIEMVGDGFFFKLIRGLPENYEDYAPASHNRGILICTLALFPALFCVWHSSLYKAGTKKILVGVILVLFALLLIVTESQTTHLASFLAVFAFFLFPLQYKIVRYGIIGVLAILMVSAPFLATTLFHALPPLINDIDWFRQGYAPERLEIWDFVSRYALQNPLYGYGIEATRAIEAFDSAMIYRDVPHVLHPHNFALQFWIEFGIIGVITGIVGLSIIIWKIAQTPPVVTQYIFAVFVIALVIASTSYGFWQGWWLGALIYFTALSVALMRFEAVQERKL